MIEGQYPKLKYTSIFHRYSKLKIRPNIFSIKNQPKHYVSSTSFFGEVIHKSAKEGHVLAFLAKYIAQ